MSSLNLFFVLSGESECIMFTAEFELSLYLCLLVTLTMCIFLPTVS